MNYVMKNNIPALIKERGIKISDLHAQILSTGERISYQSLLEIAKEEAANNPLPEGIRAGTLKLIAVALGVTFNDMIEIEPA
jgi:DNA-binding Xre family transcriptional regulator